MSKSGDLRKEILEKTSAYYRALQQEKEKDPGNVRHIRYGGRVYDDREIVNLVDSSLEFWLTYGRYSRQFEKDLAGFLGLRYSLLVNSGSSANLLAFMALTSPMLGPRSVRRGDEVITLACGFPTTVAPVIQFGAVPVFVDVDLVTFNIDVAQLEKALSGRTRVVMVAHTLGNPFDVAGLKAFCDKHKLWLIEDNCDALGSRYDGKYTGTFGDIGTSSFYPPHHLTMGEGGAVYTNDPLLKKIMASLRDWGRDCECDSGVDNTCRNRFSGQYGNLPQGYDHKYVYSHLGYNLKVTDMQASIGCAQLEKLPGFIQKRREHFAMFRAGLDDMKNFLLLPEATPSSEPSWFGFSITLREGCRWTRNEMAQHLEAKGIQTRNLFAGNLTKHPAFAALLPGKDYRISGDLKNTDKLMRDCFWIGVYPGLSREDIEYCIATIKEFIKRRL